MPEGDAIRRTADMLRPRLVGRRVTAAEPRSLERCAGRVVEGVDATGKHLLIRFDGGLILHTHMRMRGSWRVLAPGAPPRPSPRAVRARLDLDDGWAAVCVAAPVVELTSTRAWASPVDHLGPDVLAEPLDLERILARVPGSEAGELGVLLLDQRVSAGIGNMWRCEVLWELRLDPWAPLAEVDAATLRACYLTAHDLMLGALRGTRRRTAVHARGRRPCLRCQRPIAVRAQGEHGRLTYWCPACQRERRIGA
jgi:endonuclease-8